MDRQWVRREAWTDSAYSEKYNSPTWLASMAKEVHPVLGNTAQSSVISLISQTQTWGLQAHTRVHTVQWVRVRQHSREAGVELTSRRLHCLRSAALSCCWLGEVARL